MLHCWLLRKSLNQIQKSERSHRVTGKTGVFIRSRDTTVLLRERDLPIQARFTVLFFQTVINSACFRMTDWRIGLFNYRLLTGNNIYYDNAGTEAKVS